MTNEIIKKELSKLKKSGDAVTFNIVVSDLESYLNFKCSKFNSWKCNYCESTNKYEISGSALLGTATIMLR